MIAEGERSQNQTTAKIFAEYAKVSAFGFAGALLGSGFRVYRQNLDLYPAAEGHPLSRETLQ